MRANLQRPIESNGAMHPYRSSCRAAPAIDHELVAVARRFALARRVELLRGALFVVTLLAGAFACVQLFFHRW